MSEDRGKADNAAGSPDVDATAAGTSDSAPAASRPTGKRPGRRTHAAATESQAAKVAGTPLATKAKPEKPRKENLFKRLRKFLREVMTELRKVIWPNRKQMITYTTVVLTFVAFMVAFISGLDLAFREGVSWLFG
ncbi:preprotein translocase subunit SecE [Rhodococcus sp. NPDC055112]